MAELLLQNLTWRKAREAFEKFPVVVVPVASTEQHGTVLPLGTDYFIGTKVAQEAAEEAGAVCTPTVPIGVSPHHRQFWGTLWVPAQVFIDYLTHVCLSLKEHRICKVVIANSHGGNAPAIGEVIYNLRKDHGMLAVEWEWWNAVKDSEASRGMWVPGHAGAGESSLMLAFYRSLVDEEELERSGDPTSPTNWIWPERLPDGRPSSKSRLEEFGATIGRWDLGDLSSTGCTDDPSLGDAEKGRQMYEMAKKKLIELLIYLKDARLEDYLPQPHAV
ncbi:hypothetical protein AC482_06660 [miscellaneous Crenarchaeota group-15 archaeon DG-45]|uniref:Creatininase n=1 Tax=miscellaneous Crenarchaeota group-15 archaeon DG-45 TaxID=1685127 RepID=A0A0M0BLC7_9ARCH|nr:MAG: hypothetical protein AC482_06660 [miscellaneous Crenarchaeota group-15 archaeon DG-45]